MTTPKLALPELSTSQAGKEITHNQALAILDQIAQASVVDKDLAAPPGSPANGAAYIVASSPTGAWAGKAGQIAFWLSSVSAWTFIVPAAGWIVWVADEAERYQYSGSLWLLTSGSVAYSSLITEATTARTLGLIDAGAFLLHTNASASTVTVPPQASVPWAANTEIHIYRDAAGSLILTPGAGVTLKAPSGGTLTLTNNMAVTLKRIGTNIWLVIGQTVAA